MLRATLCVVLVGLAAAACGGAPASTPAKEPAAPFAPATTAPTPSWEESRIERQIRTSLLKHAKVAVVAKCREPDQWATGQRFPCTVIFPEQLDTHRIRVRMKADRTYDWGIWMAG